MSSLHKICLYLTLLAILSLSSCTPWQDWNTAITANDGNPVNNFTIPSLPSYWQRNYGVSAINTNYTQRKNQYLTYYTIKGLGTCNVYCGPRSFLVQDLDGNIVCQRDYSSSYWGAILDTNGNPYDGYCVPNVDSSATCHMVNLYLNAIGNSCHNLDSVPYGQGTVYTSCCFQDSLKANNPDYILYDEVTFNVNTTYTSLLDSEFL